MIEASECKAFSIMAMDLVDQVRPIGKIISAVRRDYRPVFESGPKEQLM
jgi:hypothetical protein